MVRRVFYAAAGPADIIASHHHWMSGTHNPTEVSITFSGQIQDYCRDIGAHGYFISVHPDAQKIEDGGFIHEHRPKRARSGIGYYFEELRYAFGLLKTARRFKADVALLDSGVTFFFAMSIFRLFGIPVVPILHNTLWASGFRSEKLSRRIVDWLDSCYFRWLAFATIAVSPEAARQVEILAPKHAGKIFEIRAQFHRAYFATIPPPPDPETRPFQVMFIGRVDRIKGVLDIPDMARRIEDASPGLVKWVICGRGKDYDELIERVSALNVGAVVDILGWTSMETLSEVYAASHASIVPTRSLFAEGLAMTAAESILAGRPLISNPVVPALELLSAASVAARTDDIASHADAVVKLASDPVLYRQLCDACPSLAEQFYDRDMGLAAVLRKALSPL